MKLDIKSIHSEHHHYGWNNKNEPKAIIKNDQLIELETIDSSGGQLNNLSTIEDIKNLDFSKVNPVTGPLYIENSEPGDTIEILRSLILLY